MINGEADRVHLLPHQLLSRPRIRRCLLQGCEQRFHPRQPRQRYCSEGCREAARKWSRRKATEKRHRANKNGTGKADATASAQRAGHQQSQRHLTALRGSREALTLAIIGILIGSAGAVALTRLMASMLFGVTATDPLMFVSVTLLMLAIALMAGLSPAPRAARVDPIEALRSE